MMVYENDKLKIPETYLKMSASELKHLKEKTLKENISDRQKGVDLPQAKEKTNLVVNWR